MGIIKQQSIQSSIYNYIGVGLGFLNSAILLPLLLSEEQLGMLSFLNSLSSIIAALCTLGTPLVTLKLFPHYRNASNQNNGFFSYTLIMTLTGAFLGIIGYWLSQDYLLSDNNSAKGYTPFVLGFSAILIFRIVFRNFDGYIRMLFNTVLGSFLENLLLKLCIFIALAIYWWLNGYDYSILFYLYSFALSLPGIVSIVYLALAKDKSLNLSLFMSASKGLGKEILSISVYGLLGTLGVLVVVEIDAVMIGNMLSLEHTAIYKTSFFFGTFCSIPSRALKRISVVMASEAWKNNDLESIKKLYQKSSLNLFLFGTYLFLGVWINLDYVYEILPDAYASGRMVILIIGVSQLFDLITGVNSEIISSSKHYKFTTYFICLLIILAISFNYLLIPSLGIDGAALASLLSIIIYNISKLIFLYWKIKIQPFTISILKIIGIACICFLIPDNILPQLENIYLGILIKGGLLTILFWTLAYFLKVSEDINQTIDKTLKKL